MSQKSELVSARVSPDSKARFEAIAAEHGLSPSEFFRVMIDEVSGEAEVPEQRLSKARREGKVTVRLGSRVRAQLEKEAREQGVPPSSWAGRLLTARLRFAPQPVDGERRFIRWGFRQLRGIATNLNQIATVMNRGVFTGDTYAPSRAELSELSKHVAELRSTLMEYAAGRLRYQLGESQNDCGQACFAGLRHQWTDG
ncbi:plasmid mobilization relaxosome protein MobC [Phaeobacter inhibens]|nr:plasmid mobilization relaxosome protein MobC [Phaeobacter inhibens]